jgi:hypothetical protein
LHGCLLVGRLRSSVSRGILAAMDDQDILAQIQGLIDEEHALRESDADEHRARVAQIEVSLDQCWDLLRQRRARRSAHQDPDDAGVREGGVVEGYQQ